MKKDICDRTLKLAIRIVKLCQYLHKQSGVARTISQQLVRSGTSIGANVEEAQAAQSTADFVCKMAIALKESRETRYWLKLLVATEVVTESRLLGLQAETEEIVRILGAIVSSKKQSEMN